MNRTLALCQVLGWQGGTIHQVCEETGLTNAEILDTDIDTDMALMGLASDFNQGWFVAGSNSVRFNMVHVFPKYRGNVAFWMGAASRKIYENNR